MAFLIYWIIEFSYLLTKLYIQQSILRAFFQPDFEIVLRCNIKN